MATSQGRDFWGAIVAQSSFKRQQFGAGNPHLLFLGGEQSGKSSLQLAFFGKLEEPPPTLALSYQSCTIKVSSRPVTLHLWELGSGLQLDRILDSIVTDETRPGFTIFICMNLMSALSITDALEWVAHIPERFPNGERPVFLIGTHYDEFENRDPRDRELIARGLRAFAAQSGIGLCFTSTRSETLVTRFKNIIKFVAIGGTRMREKALDVRGPIVVGPGEDEEARSDTEAIAEMRNQVNQDASIEREKSPKETSNPAENPQFAEEEIDALRVARRKELADSRKGDK
jgi:dynein light intermediate chain 2